MKKCCQQRCETPFCPQCGKIVNDDPALELLSHVRITLQRQRVLLRKISAGDCNDYSHVRDEERKKMLLAKRLLATEASVKKWGKWCGALEKLIKKPLRRPSK